MDKTVLTVDQWRGIIDTFTANPSGCFAAIQGYESATGYGEIADFQILVGISYGSLLKQSIAMLEEMISKPMVDEDGNPTGITVRGHLWQDRVTREKTNRKSGSRSLVPFVETYFHSETAFQDTAAELLENLKNPKTPEMVGFEKEADGLYSLDGDVLYIRDCLRVKKTVRKPGDYPLKATLPVTTLKHTLRKMLPVSNYRTFKLDQRFEKIAIFHTEILPDAPITAAVPDPAAIAGALGNA